jgi:hypothetical protein
MKLSDTQLLILSSASQRTDRAAVLPATLKGSAAKKVVDRLLNEKLLQELRAKDDMPVWRRGDDNRPYSLLITKAGLRAIEVEDVAEAPDDSAATGSNAVAAPPCPGKPSRASGGAFPSGRAQRRPLPFPRRQPGHRPIESSQAPNRTRSWPSFNAQRGRHWMPW